MKNLQPGSFTQGLRRLNGYKEDELRTWLFEPGMKFGDTDKWWEPRTTRTRPHEGLDLLIFLNGGNEKHLLPPGTGIPPLLSGTMVARLPDFMGETIILAHDLLDDKGRRLHTFYAHLQPGTTPASGKFMARDSQLGKIAALGQATLACPPHLHLSLAWTDESFSIRDFLWNKFRVSETFKPGDPLALLVDQGDFLRRHR